jgi:hypothetical protein
MKIFLQKSTVGFQLYIKLSCSNIQKTREPESEGNGGTYLIWRSIILFCEKQNMKGMELTKSRSDDEHENKSGQIFWSTFY